MTTPRPREDAAFPPGWGPRAPEGAAPMIPLEYEPAITHEGLLQVKKVGGNIGAVVSGLTIGADLDPALVAELRVAVLEHKVVFVRGQDHATDADQYDFATQLGKVTSPRPTIQGDARAVLPIDSEEDDASSWHTDATFVDRIPAFGVLRAVNVPPYGGTTVWANTVNAYKTLHPAMRALVCGLRAIHSNEYDDAAEHPLVRIHPETDKPSLLLGHSVRSIT